MWKMWVLMSPTVMLKCNAVRWDAVGINHGAVRPGAVLTVTAGAGEGRATVNTPNICRH